MNYKRLRRQSDSQEHSEEHDDYNPYQSQPRRLRTPRSHEQSHQDSYPEQMNIEPGPSRTRTTRNIRVNYLEEQKKQPEIQEPMQALMTQPQTFIAPQVQFLLWKKDHPDPSLQLFLVKYLNRSYLHTQWLTRQQISERGYQLSSSSLKSMRIKMKKTFELKLSSQHFFNPNFLQVDRVLTSMQVFTAIHHKKANDIKGKWDQSLVLVCQKLLNFTKEGYPYGIMLGQPYNQQLQVLHNIQPRLNIGQILNKIYLGNYKNPMEFWVQLGQAIGNFLKIYEAKGDYQIVGKVMMEAAIFLYQQWQELYRMRYESVRSEMEKKGLMGEKIVSETQQRKDQNASSTIRQPMQQQQPQKQLYSMPKDLLNLPEHTTIADIKTYFCTQNILLTQKNVDFPQSPAQLALLQPPNYSYIWLPIPPPSSQYRFQHLSKEDLKRLDLNLQTDKLYYIKWKDLSYSQSTWQSQKQLNCPAKIQQFKLWNKIPIRDVRQRFQIHNKIHKFLLQYYQHIGDSKGMVHNANVQKMEIKFYLSEKKNTPAKQYSVGQGGPVYKNRRKLKDFQIQSLNWMIKNWYQNRNSILADQMGLGKTVQTIAFLSHLYTYENVLGPFLVVAPLSTLHQWRRQIQEWTSFNCLLYYDQGKSQARQIIQQYQFYHWHTTKSGDIIPSKLPKFHILLTNYQLLINDFEVLKKIPYQHIVLDQAHRLKNKTTKTTFTLNQLPCSRKTLLTGTPIQNNTKELWTLLNFIEPKTFASQQKFIQLHGSLSAQQQVKQFKKMLKPYLLRRVKQDVQSTIPRLSQTIIDVQMSSRQKQYYRGILQHNKKAILKSLNHANFNSLSIQLRKCCNHPYLISSSTEQEIKAGALTFQENMNRFITSSGKMILLVKLLQKFKKEGKKVLVFSQFVIMLDLMKPYLQAMGYNCQILKGSQSSTLRHQAITRFNQQDTDIFLISTKAGGVGINLVAATEIVIYDSDWNPQNDIQATARAHRIGQKKQVTVYRLIISNSYESQMFQLSSKKLGLDKAIFTGDCFKSMGQFDQNQKNLTKNEIQTLLKKGIVGFLQNRVDQDQYFNQSIEDILQNNTRKVEYSMGNNSTVFSKTKFKVQEGNSQINIEAEDFWEKALQGVQTPVDKLVNKRTQLKQYSTVKDQQDLLLQTYKIVVDFVRQKTQGTNFNAQDQRNLLRFLQAINSSRHFNRHLRNIADQLSMEIQKPSRRFKVKQEDIIVEKDRNYQLKTEPVQKRYSSRLKKLKPDSKDSLGFEAIQPQDQISDVQQQKQQSSPTPEPSQKNQQLQKIAQDYLKLCFLCQRPRCTIFCPGICGRSFHAECFNHHNDHSHQMPSNLKQAQHDYQTWQSNIKAQLCINCKQKDYTFRCAICLQQGTYVDDQISASTNNKKKKNLRIKKQFEIEDENTLYKCSALGKCHNFFHLKCLFTKEFQGKFSDHSGKTIKEISLITKSFRCPSHYCHNCYGTDPKSTKIKSYKCIRCCRSIHDKCLDKTLYARLGKQHYYICLSHLEPHESVEKLTVQIESLKPSKRDRMKMSIQKKGKDKKVKEDESKALPKIAEQEAQKFESMQSESKYDQSSTVRKSTRIRSKQSFIQKSKENQEKTGQARLDQKQFTNNEFSKSKIEEKKEISVKNGQNNKSKSKDSKNQSMQNSRSRQKKQKQKKEKKRSSKLQEMSVQKQFKRQQQSQKDKPLKQSANISQVLFPSLKYQYSDYNLIPIQNFDYSTYSYPWCRYCGSRYAKGSFQQSPWGSQQLCAHHHVQWKQQNRLRMDKYKHQPKHPINKKKENQLKYLNQYSKEHKLSPKQTIAKLNLINEID